MPVYAYLDLSTAHLTEAEMDAVNDRLAALEHESPRVIAHEHGAWVNVVEAALTSAEGAAELAAALPNLSACLSRARELGCAWINFDADAAYDDVLPTYEW